MYHCFDWLQGGIVSLPYFQYYFGGMNCPSSWMRKSWGSRMLTSSFSISLPKCLGTLEGQRWSLKLQHFLDGVLHRVVAIEGACCSLYNALESTLLNHSDTVFKSYHSWGVSWLCPWESNKRFVETFCWVEDKKITFLLAQKAQTWETSPATQC